MKFPENVILEPINSFAEFHFILITFNFSAFHGFSVKIWNSENLWKWPYLAVIDENTQNVTNKKSRNFWSHIRQPVVNGLRWLNLYKNPLSSYYVLTTHVIPFICFLKIIDRREAGKMIDDIWKPLNSNFFLWMVVHRFSSVCDFFQKEHMMKY